MAEGFTWDGRIRKRAPGAGRPRVSDEVVKKLFDLHYVKKKNVAEACRRAGVSRTTFYRLVKEYPDLIPGRD